MIRFPKNRRGRKSKEVSSRYLREVQSFYDAIKGAGKKLKVEINK